MSSLIEILAVDQCIQGQVNAFPESVSESQSNLTGVAHFCAQSRVIVQLINASDAESGRV